MTKGTILVVEDDMIIASLIESRLKKLGYAVSATVGSGEEAIVAASEQRPDLVLMDIYLAGEVDGITASRIIRDQAKIPIVFLTSYSDEGTLERAKKTEPAGYIIKPFTDEALRTTIDIALYREKGGIKAA